MTRSRTGTRLITAAAALLLASAGLAAGPAPAAHAQSNYRVCGVWNSAKVDDGRQIGTGLVTKVYKGGLETCKQKLNYMFIFYGTAYQGSWGRYSFSMMTCEDFGRDSGTGADPCYGLGVNGIYKFTSPNDRDHPNPAYFSFWHS